MTNTKAGSHRSRDSAFFLFLVAGYSFGLRTVYRPAGTIAYRNEDGSGGVETAYGYTWHSGTLAVEQHTTTLPAVPTAQNGSGVSATRVERFDTDGRTVWTRDERGYLTHHEYDPATGNRLVSIADVETDLVDDEPSGWTTPADGGMHLISDFSYDVQGRLIESLGPEHEVDGQTVRTASWTVYDDAQNEVRSARGFATPQAGSSSGSGDSYTYTLVNPVSISWQDPSGRASESITATLGSGVTREGKLTASDTFAQSSYVRWSTSAFNSAGQHTDSRQYHTIPVSGEGTEGTHYDQTRSGYDSAGRQNATTAPGGTITRTVFDVKGNPVETYVGTDDTGASDTDPTGGSSSGSAGNNMVLVTENEYYDGAVTGCGTQLTLSTQHVDDATTRVTSNEYDWRGRHTGVSGEEDLYQRTTFDNLDRPIRIETYDTNASGTLLSRGESSYDDLGRVYQSTTYAV
ncbi:MAG: RHS repeat-associated core domain-containing protein, partial [Planctomycetes bacterium]|nr:RHS repeat-associated core domain-containing protein [Planctomycetota bacterium]